ncbi:hypothetical protein H4582DRAFT_2133260, partial [Lactarius indigo]
MLSGMDVSCIADSSVGGIAGLSAMAVICVAVVILVLNHSAGPPRSTPLRSPERSPFSSGLAVTGSAAVTGPVPSTHEQIIKLLRRLPTSYSSCSLFTPAIDSVITISNKRHLQSDTTTPRALQKLRHQAPSTQAQRAFARAVRHSLTRFTPVDSHYIQSLTRGHP